MHELEDLHARTNENTVLADIHKLVREFRDEAAQEVLYLGLRDGARAYGEGDRPGRTLAWLTRPTRDRRPLTAISTSSGEVVTDTEEILQEFVRYYEHLYDSKL